MTKNIVLKKFEFEKFFTGKVVATGYMCFFYPKTRRKKLKVIFKGVFKKIITLPINGQKNCVSPEKLKIIAKKYGFVTLSASSIEKALKDLVKRHWKALKIRKTLRKHCKTLKKH